MSIKERRQQAIAMWEASEWRDVALYIGPNADRFRNAWENTRAKALEKGGGIAFGWSWPALLFGFAWFLYRKQWVAGTALIVLPLFVILVLHIDAAMGGVGIAMAMFAKSFVATEAVTRIANIRAKGGGDAEIAAAGGVSIAGGVIGGSLWLLAAASVLATLILTRGG